MKFDIRNLEKYITGSTFLLSTLAVIYKFLVTNTGNSDMIYFSLGLGGIFVTRKAVSYFKPNQYYFNNIGGTEVATDSNVTNNTTNVVTPSPTPEQQNTNTVTIKSNY